MTGPEFGDAWDLLEDPGDEWVLGTVLLSQAHAHMLPALFEEIAADDFRDAHLGEMWTAAKQVLASGAHVSARSILAVRDTGPIRQRIKNWTGEPIYPLRVNVAARQVVEAAKLRHLVEALIRTAQFAPQAESYSEAVEFAWKQLGSLSEAEPSRDCRPFSEVLERWWNWLDAPVEKIRVVPTPWADLNEMLAGGLHPGRSYVIGGRPGDGKSLVLMNLATHAAESGHPVAAFSVEMGDIEVASRIMASGARAEYGRITRRQVDERNRLKLAEYADTYGAMPLMLVDRSDITVDQIAAQCRTLKRKQGLDVVVVDYLQLLRETESRAARERQVAHISRSLKILARELDCVVLVACQLNRNAATADRPPALSELRESGSIEQDADVVVLLHHELANGEPTGMVALKVAKNRTGRLGNVLLPWRPHQARIG